MSIKIIFNFKDVSFLLPNRKLLKTFIAKLFQKEQITVQQLDYIFCSDQYLLKLNKTYLGHDYYTDVITFTLSDSSEPIRGEIYISIDRIRENAKLYDRSFRNELHRIMLHGALHLSGYTDKRKKDKELMTKKEDYYLTQFIKVSRGT